MRRMLDRAVHALAEGVDRAFLRASFQSRRAGARATRASVLERLDAAAAFYGSMNGQLYPAVPPPLTRSREVRTLPRGAVLDLSWRSGYEPLHDSHAETLRRCPENEVCHARWYRHRAPAPAVICLHGWGAGQFAIEERAFAARWMYERLGVDVVLATLPFHARRKPARRWTPMFPSTNPIRTTEGFAQAVRDVRALAAALRASGAPAVGVAGMSLGGYTSALLATVDPTLDFAIPIIAFSCVAGLMWEHGEGTSARRRAEAIGLDLPRFASAFVAARPLARKPVVPGDRVLVIAGERDRVCSLAHARALQAHFGAALETFPGAHLLQVGRARAFGAMARFLARLGLASAR